MSSPLVSCILTCSSSNRVNLARKAVNNFIQQYYKPYELLIVNSTGTPILTNKELTSPVDRQEGNHLIEIPATPGLNSASMKNVGLSAAQGDWVICIDDDDYFHPMRLLYQMAHRVNNQPCMLQYQLMIDITKVLTEAKSDNPVQPILHLLKRSHGIPSTMLFPRLSNSGEAFLFNTTLNIGEYDELLAHMIAKGYKPTACQNSNNRLVPELDLPLLSIAVYHGLNELQPYQFFSPTESQNTVDTLNTHNMQLLQRVLRLYDFEVSLTANKD